jgi:chromosome partitioning protein
VRVARLVVVPVQPSPLDLWATAETLKMARDERRRSLVVLNRVPPRSRLTEDIAADLASAGTPIAATRIGNRVALALTLFVRAEGRRPKPFTDSAEPRARRE